MLTKPAKAVTLKVSDVNGTVVREFRTASGEVGYHRTHWNLSGQGGGGGGGFGRGGGGGAAVPAGGYRVTLTVDGKDYTQALVVENDPRPTPRRSSVSISRFRVGMTMKRAKKNADARPDASRVPEGNRALHAEGEGLTGFLD